MRLISDTEMRINGINLPHEVDMAISQLYIALSIAILAIIFLLVFVVGRVGKGKRLTPLAGLAFGFVLAGTLLGDNRFIGYSLLGIGVTLAVVDMLNKRKQP